MSGGGVVGSIETDSEFSHTSLFLQSIRGLWFLSQGNPRIIVSFPKEVTSNWVLDVVFPVDRFIQANSLIGPILFVVLSTFLTGMGGFTSEKAMLCVRANCLSMKTPAAPESSSAWVVTMGSCLIITGIRMD